MIKMLSPHSLSVVPPQVLHALRQISQTLPNQISEAFSSQPAHVLEAKMTPARIFSSLLDRMLRVNEAAHASARILSHAPDRRLMRNDWQAFVNAKSIVARELPCRAPEVIDILNTEVIKLLFPDGGENDKDLGLTNGLTPEPVETDSSTETILDHWVQFLSSLPSRFPNVTPRMFMLTIGAVESACLRDITMAGGEGFGGWWVIRCWIDEWLAWTAERSGFLRYVPKRLQQYSSIPQFSQDEINFDLLAPLQPNMDHHNHLKADQNTHNRSSNVNHHNTSSKQMRHEEHGNDDSGVSLREDLLDDLVGGPEKLDSASLEMAFSSHT